ncbi:DUF805 domain-containing protein (plasmid) [Niallia circulans]|uniref:DUF805 domain-containing protein n=1 Tax=Niallia circulans TaxID=1397 RepID=UPI000F90E143|nr:DUF805 domain-containing protein [Niallia circulans]QJX65158.1 DUF805 domain-containing protein [Niallia circulans]
MSNKKEHNMDDFLSIENLYGLLASKLREAEIWNKYAKVPLKLFIATFIITVVLFIAMLVTKNSYMLLTILTFIFYILLATLSILLPISVRRKAFSNNYRLYDYKFALFHIRKNEIKQIIKDKKLDKQIPYDEIIELLEGHSNSSKKDFVDLSILLALSIPMWNWFIKSIIDTENPKYGLAIAFLIVFVLIVLSTKYVILKPFKTIVNYKSDIFNELALIFKDLKFQAEYSNNSSVEKNRLVLLQSTRNDLKQISSSMKKNKNNKVYYQKVPENIDRIISKLDLELRKDLKETKN